jgi:hypothetical protein
MTVARNTFEDNVELEFGLPSYLSNKQKNPEASHLDSNPPLAVLRYQFFFVV